MIQPEMILDDDERFVETYVAPFYLQWMSANALTREGHELLAEVRTRATEIDEPQIRSMLRHHWRIQVMGAWYATARPDLDLTDAIHHSIRICYGTLTAPALCVAAITHHNADTADVLTAYRARSVEGGDGAVNIVTAAIQHLDPDGPLRGSDLGTEWTGERHERTALVLRDLLAIGKRLGTRD